MMLYCEDWVFIQCMRKAEYDLRLQVCKPEINAEKGVKLQQHEEEALRFFFWLNIATFRDIYTCNPYQEIFWC